MTRLPIKYARPYTWLLTGIGVPAGIAYVQVDGDDVRVHMGWAFGMRFPRGAIADVAPFHTVVSVGVHGWRGRWLVNGAHRPIAASRCTRRHAPG